MNILSTSRPLVSIILPVCNVGHFLPECLDSLVSQSYDNIEVIAIDDYSRDDSWKILKIYKKFDKRIRVYKNIKHYGKAITLNRALKRAKGDFVVMMDPKDILYKEKIKKQLKALLDNPKLVAVGTQCTLINSMSKRVGKTDFPHEYDAIYHQPLHTISINFETVMIQKSLLPKDLLYFNSSEKNMLYSDVLIKLLQFGQIINLNELLQYKRTISSYQPILGQIGQIPHLFKLWVKSIDTYDYQPSIRSFFSSVFKSPTLSQ